MDLKQVLTSFNLILLSAICLANPLDQAFEKADTVRLATELVQLCTSNDLDRLAYCKAYIRGAAHFWKSQSACASLARESQLFCAGAESARTSMRDAISACADCDQREGLRRFRDELKTGGDICTTEKGRDEHYCAGYNAEVEITIARLMPCQPIEAGQSARDVGLVHAFEDVFLHLWGSGEFGAFAPCLELDVRPEQMSKVFAQFMIENPAQQRDTSAVMALEKALYYGLCPGQEHGLIPHMEQCTKWGYDNGNLETRNDCDEAVAVQFMEQRKDVIERRLAHGYAL